MVYSIYAVLVDVDNNTTTIPPISVTVNNLLPTDVSPPTGAITSPPGGSTVAGNTLIQVTSVDDQLIDFIEYYTPNGELLDYAYAYISPEADLIQVLSFAITGINEIRYNLYQVTTQHDTFFYTGIAVRENKYQNGLGMDLSRFITNNEMGPQFEIHINDDDSSAFLKLENKFH